MVRRLTQRTTGGAIVAAAIAMLLVAAFAASSTDRAYIDPGSTAVVFDVSGDAHPNLLDGAPPLVLPDHVALVVVMLVVLVVWAVLRARQVDVLGEHRGRGPPSSLVG